MKKILVLTTLLLSFAGSVFAAPLGNATLTSSGASVYGGQTAAAALAATGAQIKLSNKVVGVINYDASNFPVGTSASYAIGTKHDGGSKIFGTGNSSTNIYYRIVPALPFANAAVVDKWIAATVIDGSGFTTANSWSSF